MVNATSGLCGGALLALVVAMAPVAGAAPRASDAESGQGIAPPPVRRSAGTLSAFEANVLARANLLRRRHGRGPLRVSAALMAAAEQHTRAMVTGGFFEHRSADGTPFWRRIERLYPSQAYTYWAVGENLEYGSPDLEPTEVLDDWLRSPGHRDNLLWRRWREVGLAALHVESAPGEYDGEPVTVVTLDVGVRVK